MRAEQGMNKEMVELKNKNTAAVRGDLQRDTTKGIIISAEPPAAAEVAAAAAAAAGSRFFMPHHTTY